MTTITVPRAVVEQVLEALTVAWQQNPRWQITEGMHALRAALAEPVQEPEPAGWFEGPFGEFRANPLYRIAWPAQTVAWSIPLYLAPPQRKPLTQDEIPALAEKAWTPSVYCDAEALLGTDGLVALVRAVEAKHGIKESP